MLTQHAIQQSLLRFSYARIGVSQKPREFLVSDSTKPFGDVRRNPSDCIAQLGAALEVAQDGA
jgi:hypothetical protein